ncbi:glutamate formimidoyltransferase [Owenweeksia hongkongensis]|uniref:glutamate formimidoyltransferase n=1 Tax=Owenweeksia hongkongensis TaxID=253245 RepID=UPI003A940B30
MQILECVPNISEGRDANIIEAIAQCIRSVKGVKLLHIDSGLAANRTVYTFAGRPEAVMEAAFQMYLKAYELIDMSKHLGTHPRQGVVDVCPFIPLQGITMNEVIDYTVRLALKLEEAINIPGYYYEYSAVHPVRVNLAFLRKGQYESLPAKFDTLPPDFGDPQNWERFGVTVMGARRLLIAYNVNLNTKDVSIAKKIASNVRESGKWEIAESGERSKVFGKLKSVKGLGWYIEDFQKAQVSYNLTDITEAGMLDVFLATQEEAEKLGVEVTGSELVGLAPISEFHKAAQRSHSGQTFTDDEAITEAIKFLGLDELKPFDPNQKIIERLIDTEEV